MKNEIKLTLKITFSIIVFSLSMQIIYLFMNFSWVGISTQLENLKSNNLFWKQVILQLKNDEYKIQIWKKVFSWWIQILKNTITKSENNIYKLVLDENTKYYFEKKLNWEMYFYSNFNKKYKISPTFEDENIYIFPYYWVNFLNKLIKKILFFIIFTTWFSIICYIFLKKHFTEIENYNKNLIDYNHFLAHEIKTPISIVHSDLEILKYEYDIEKIKRTQNELKNITKIVDWLLHFSQNLKLWNKKLINLEKFLNEFIQNYDKNLTQNIKIYNNEFNFHIKTDEVLFKRILKNLIENWIKHSSDKKLEIFITKEKIAFKNKITKNFTSDELNNFLTRFYTKEKAWTGLWIPLIKEISKVLWYTLALSSKNNYFIVEIYF